MVTESRWDGDGLCKGHLLQLTGKSMRPEIRGCIDKYNASASLSSALLFSINVPKFPRGNAAVQKAGHRNLKPNRKQCYQQDAHFKTCLK